MKIKKLVFLFCVLLFSGSLCSGKSYFPFPINPKHVPGQDPAVEKMFTLGHLIEHATHQEEPLGITGEIARALRINGPLCPNDDWWWYMKALMQLEKETKNPESKALISWQIGNCPVFYFDRLNMTPEEIEKVVEIYNKHGIYYPHPYLYDNTIRAYIQDTGRWEEALQRIENGTFEPMLEEIKEELKNILRTYIRKAEEYDPDLSLAWIDVYYHHHPEGFLPADYSFGEKWVRENLARIYYTTKAKYRWELPRWQEEVTKIEHSIYAQELSFQNLSMEEIKKAIEEEYISGCLIEYLWVDLLYFYRWEGDYEKAIYYGEKIEVFRPVVRISLEEVEAGAGYRGNVLQDIRSKYLEQLKKKGEVDKLHPFIYINDKPLDPRKGFTKGGVPYVSTLDFSKAIGASTEWKRKGKLLKIKSGDINLVIANIKGQWKVYSDEGKREINAYLKDGELYMPLKELCTLLNLELQWDDKTFIAKVNKK